MRNYFPLHFQKDEDNFCNSVVVFDTRLKCSIKISNILLFVTLIKLYYKLKHFFS